MSAVEFVLLGSAAFTRRLLNETPNSRSSSVGHLSPAAQVSRVMVASAAKTPPVTRALYG